MNILKKLFGKKGKTEQEITIPTILNLFEESAKVGHIEGKSIVAVAAIYLHAPKSPSTGFPVEMPPHLHLAQMYIDSYKRTGYIVPHLSLVLNAQIRMRQLHQEESTAIPSINHALATMLVECCDARISGECRAISLNGDTPAFGMFWIAIVATESEAVDENKPVRQLERISPDEAQRRRTARKNLVNEDLSGYDLRSLYLADVDFTGSDLTDASLWGMNLDKCIFKNANLRNANLGSTNLQAADLTGANLTGAILRGAHLMGGAQLSGAIMPDGRPYILNMSLHPYTDQ